MREGRRPRLRRRLGAAFLLACLGASPWQAGVTVTFLANEGVLLEGGGRKVLIDGLVRFYDDGFALPHDSTQRALEAARVPFALVDALLVTHRHGDHFHPAPVAAHLRANPRAVLVTSAQVIDSLRRAGGTFDERRLLARTTAPGTTRRVVVNGIAIDLLGIPHTGGRRQRAVEHLAYLVHIGGRRVVHFGDGDLTGKTLAPFRLDTLGVDVALVPEWIVSDDEGRATIERWVRPRQVVAVHVGAGQGEVAARRVARTFPAAVTFSRSLESRRW